MSIAYQPTPTELRAYSLMQARMLALLLRFSEPQYRKLFARQDQFQDAADVLPVYRDLGVLFYLRDELFDHILPRILRRLSFSAPRRLVVEEPPGRGRIDWERSLAATWAERPGEPPLELHGRQSIRDFATAENLLTVVTLLEYRSDVRRILVSDAVGTAEEALRHPLNEIVARCERELAFPQLTGIRTTAQHYLEGAAGGVAALEQRVAQSAIPGGNSAYDDLLAWRRRYRELNLLQRLREATPSETLGVNPRRDNRLYQLWILFELADLLTREGRLIPDATALPDRLAFRWGADSDERCYTLQHDRGIEDPPEVWKAAGGADKLPGVRPDYYLQRSDPVPTIVRDDAAVAWREPGIVWDAKYYREKDTNNVPSEPVKRMLADLALTGEVRGSLMFAFLRADETAADNGTGILVQRLQPRGSGVQHLDPQLSISALALRPDQPEDAVRQTLTNLLDDAHTSLREPIIPACHGMFLDEESVAERGAVIGRSGKALVAEPKHRSELLICPKPHIGAWRIDLVRRDLHCLQDPQLCHIVHQTGARKPVRPPRSIESLLTELDHILADQPAGELDEETVSAVAERVQQLTRRYAAWEKIDLEFYYERVRGLGMRETFALLQAPEQESLALAVFLTDQLFKVGANDYSAPAIHLSSVIEIEVKRRVFACPDIAGDLTNPKRQTLGVLPYLKRIDDVHGNWGRISAYVAAHWNERPHPYDPERVISFDDVVNKGLNRVSQLRNNAAHTEPLPRRFYDELQDMVFQGGRLGFGLLNTLLLAWRSD